MANVAKGISKAGDNIVASFISNPRSLIYTAIGIAIIVMAIRFMRRDKRKANEDAKNTKDLMDQQDANKKILYDAIAKKYGTTTEWVAGYDDIALKLASSYSDKWFKSDDEEEIVNQFNRINAWRGLETVDLFFKTYTKNPDSNVAYDLMKTLTRQQFAKIGKQQQDWLVQFARIKGDISFFDWKYGI